MPVKKKLSLQPQAVDDYKASSVNIWNSSPYQKDDRDETCVIPQNDDFSSPPPPVASVHSSFNLQFNPNEESTTPPGHPGQSNSLYPKLSFDDDEDRFEKPTSTPKRTSRNSTAVPQLDEEVEKVFYVGQVPKRLIGEPEYFAASTPQAAKVVRPASILKSGTKSTKSVRRGVSFATTDKVLLTPMRNSNKKPTVYHTPCKTRSPTNKDQLIHVLASKPEEFLDSSDEALVPYEEEAQNGDEFEGEQFYDVSSEEDDFDEQVNPSNFPISPNTLKTITEATTFADEEEENSEENSYEDDNQQIIDHIKSNGDSEEDDDQDPSHLSLNSELELNNSAMSFSESSFKHHSLPKLVPPAHFSQKTKEKNRKSSNKSSAKSTRSSKSKRSLSAIPSPFTVEEDFETSRLPNGTGARHSVKQLDLPEFQYQQPESPFKLLQFEFDNNQTPKSEKAAKNAPNSPIPAPIPLPGLAGANEGRKRYKSLDERKPTPMKQNISKSKPSSAHIPSFPVKSDSVKRKESSEGLDEEIQVTESSEINKDSLEEDESSEVTQLFTVNSKLLKKRKRSSQLSIEFSPILKKKSVSEDSPQLIAVACSGADMESDECFTPIKKSPHRRISKQKSQIDTFTQELFEIWSKLRSATSKSNGNRCLCQSLLDSSEYSMTQIYSNIQEKLYRTSTQLADDLFSGIVEKLSSSLPNQTKMDILELNTLAEELLNENNLLLQDFDLSFANPEPAPVPAEPLNNAFDVFAQEKLNTNLKTPSNSSASVVAPSTAPAPSNASRMQPITVSAIFNTPQAQSNVFATQKPFQTPGPPLPFEAASTPASFIPETPLSGQFAPISTPYSLQTPLSSTPQARQFPETPITSSTPTSLFKFSSNPFSNSPVNELNPFEKSNPFAKKDDTPFQPANPFSANPFLQSTPMAKEPISYPILSPFPQQAEEEPEPEAFTFPQSQTVLAFNFTPSEFPFKSPASQPQPAAESLHQTPSPQKQHKLPAPKSPVILATPKKNICIEEDQLEQLKKLERLHDSVPLPLHSPSSSEFFSAKEEESSQMVLNVPQMQFDQETLLDEDAMPQKDFSVFARGETNDNFESSEDQSDEMEVSKPSAQPEEPPKSIQTILEESSSSVHEAMETENDKIEIAAENKEEDSEEELLDDESAPVNEEIEKKEASTMEDEEMKENIPSHSIELLKQSTKQTPAPIIEEKQANSEEELLSSSKEEPSSEKEKSKVKKKRKSSFESVGLSEECAQVILDSLPSSKESKRPSKSTAVEDSDDEILLDDDSSSSKDAPAAAPVPSKQSIERKPSKQSSNGSSNDKIAEKTEESSSDSEILLESDSSEEEKPIPKKAAAPAAPVKDRKKEEAKKKEEEKKKMEEAKKKEEAKRKQEEEEKKKAETKKKEELKAKKDDKKASKKQESSSESELLSLEDEESSEGKPIVKNSKKPAESKKVDKSKDTKGKATSKADKKSNQKQNSETKKTNGKKVVESESESSEVLLDLSEEELLSESSSEEETSKKSSKASSKNLAPAKKANNKANDKQAAKKEEVKKASKEVAKKPAAKVEKKPAESKKVAASKKDVPKGKATNSKKGTDKNTKKKGKESSEESQESESEKSSKESSEELLSDSEESSNDEVEDKKKKNGSSNSKNYNAMTCVQLKSELKKRGLSVLGLKAQLVERLIESDNGSSKKSSKEDSKASNKSKLTSKDDKSTKNSKTTKTNTKATTKKPTARSGRR